jgi:hypothetical protein
MLVIGIERRKRAALLSRQQSLQHGAALRIELAEVDNISAADEVSVNETPPLAPSAILMSREDVFARAPAGQDATAPRVSRDLEALIRISGAITAIRGLVALERPLIELISDVVPASRGAIVLTGGHSTEIASTAGWSRSPDERRSVQVSRSPRRPRLARRHRHFELRVSRRLD